MTFLYHVVPIESSKKSFSSMMEYSDYNDEHTFHFVCLNNSCYRTPMQFYYCMGVFCNNPYWEERG